MPFHLVRPEDLLSSLEVTDDQVNAGFHQVGFFIDPVVGRGQGAVRHDMHIPLRFGGYGSGPGRPSAIQQVPAAEVVEHLPGHARGYIVPDVFFEGVRRLFQLHHVQHHPVVLEQAVRGLHHLEAAEVKDLLVFGEADAHKVRLFRGVGPSFHVAPSVLQVELQEFLVRADAHLPFLCNDHIVLHLVIVLIDDHVVDAVAVFVLAAHFDGVVGQLGIEDTFLDVERGLGHADIIEHGVELQVGAGHYEIGQQEGQAADDGGYEDQRPHEAQQRNAG